MSLGHLFGAIHNPLEQAISKSNSQASGPESGLFLRAKAAFWHLAISLIVAAGVAAMVFGIWYPEIVREMVGGRELFQLVIIVDLVMGPMLTFVAFNPKKGASHLRRDLATIAIMQLAALGFGLHTVWLARPVHIVFEIDRLKVVTAADIDPESLKEAPNSLLSLPFWGPVMIAAPKPTDASEQVRSVELAMAGFDLAQQPRNWRAMDGALKAKFFESSMTLESARKKILGRTADLFRFNDAVVKAASMNSGGEVSLRVIPIQSKRVTWAALIDAQGKIIRTVNVDLF